MANKILCRELKDFACRYHRNGVAGDGFFLCRFIWKEGRISRLMFATVFPREGSAPSPYAVHSMDVDERWRGDDFIEALVEAIAAYGARAYEQATPADTSERQPSLADVRGALVAFPGGRA